MSKRKPPDLTPVISLKQPASRVWPMSSWLRGKVGGKAREPSAMMLLIERLADLRALVLQGDSRHAISCDCLIIAPVPALAVLAAAAQASDRTVLMALEPEPAESWWTPALSDPLLGRLARKRWTQAEGESLTDILDNAARRLVLTGRFADPDLTARLDRPKRLFPADMHPPDEGMIYLRETPHGAAEPDWWQGLASLPAPITDKRRTVLLARSVLLAGGSQGFAPTGEQGGTLQFADVSPACPVKAIGPAALAGGNPAQILEALDPFWPFRDE